MKTIKITCFCFLLTLLMVSCSGNDNATDSPVDPDSPNPSGVVNVTTIAGSIIGDINATGTAAQFRYPQTVALDAAGNIYVGDRENYKIKKITPQGVVSTFVGSSWGDLDGIGIAAKFKQINAVEMGSDGNFYVVDNNYKVKRVSASGNVTTIAGSITGLSDGPAATAKFDFPHGIVQDAAGNLYVADHNNHRIRKITPTGVVSTFAGSTIGYADGTGSEARFNDPTGLAIDSNGNLYVADRFNDRIRKITPQGVVTTIAGSYPDGDVDGTGENAKFHNPYDLVITPSGIIYVVDQDNHKIKRVTLAGVVTTIAGTTSGSADGDGNTAQFSYPRGIALDAAGNLYIADYNNHRIRKITFE